MSLSIARVVYRAWSRYDCDTQTAIRALIRLENEARTDADAFAVGVILVMRRDIWTLG